MSTLLAHTQFFIHQQPQVLSWDALCLRIAQLAFVLEILLALGLIELHEVRMGSPLKPVRVPLDSSPSLQHVSCTHSFVLLAVLLRVPSPIVFVTDKDVK